MNPLCCICFVRHRFQLNPTSIYWKNIITYFLFSCIVHSRSSIVVVAAAGLLPAKIKLSEASFACVHRLPKEASLESAAL